MTKKIKRVLVANRGEIAIRIFRACHDLDIRSVAIYSKEDMNSQFRVQADEAYLVGENMSPVGAYLDIPGIIDLAKRREIDAIHPGYGFLSENAEFARACEEAGIKFIGPSSKILGMMGDKLSAKEMAIKAGVPIIPGSTEPLKDGDEALALAESFGFPVILKAAAGGGGRGMRRCDSPEEVKPAFELVKAEAKKAFGNDDIFIEKFLVEPKHIEVQILADEHGTVYHVLERDCSLQRRYQKVVEYAPAWSVNPLTLKRIRADAVKIAKMVGYTNAGTEEFLVDKEGNYYFIEMNPRIQVEHTVTEVVTGVDLVRAQILIAQGEKLSHPLIGLNSQDDVQARCYAIQCRVTTEDPANNFAPDHGQIQEYRTGGGVGVRMDGGNAVAGSVISPYYDSLLVKITCFDNTFEGACRRALRSLTEVHIRGVKTNIPFIANILNHPTFRAGQCHTKFIDESPELFDMVGFRDRATKILRYIAQIQVDDPNTERPQLPTVRIPSWDDNVRPTGLKDMLDAKGPAEFSKWVKDQKKVLIMDTTMRDAHQSLLSTRMRTRDMVKGAKATAEILKDCFSLEMWGGATFDVAFRFLHESPWERLEWLRRDIPNIPFQMLLRGSSAVGYANYPDNVVRAFIDEAAARGIDIFRVFDSLNWIPGMEVAIDEVLKQGKFCEGTICYTGDVLDKSNTTFTLDYYVKMAKELEKRGVHSIAIKDMAGLLKPYSAKELVSALKDAVDLPIHLHSHDTTGNQIAAYLMATEAGVDIVDTAISSMAGMTSQPSMNAFVAALEGQERDPGFDQDRLQDLTDYYSDIRLRYAKFDKGLKNNATDIYKYEIPGGQYTNLAPQVASLGLATRFDDVKRMYKVVDNMLGGITKVTPSSKMVGDMAIFMVQNDLTPENIVERGETLTFPDSVVSYFKGMMGQPPHGFPVDLQKVVLKGEEPITCRPGELLEPVDFEAVKEEIKPLINHPEVDMKDIISYCLYPKVMKDYWENEREYGYLMRMVSHVFFNGMSLGEVTTINIEDGKTLVIRYLGLGDANEEEGTRQVIFEVNGSRRIVSVKDNTIQRTGVDIKIADPTDKSHSGASIPGLVTKVSCAVGDIVEKNQTLGIIEAMKMETAVVANMDGIVKEILVQEGDNVKSGQLMFVLDVKKDD